MVLLFQGSFLIVIFYAFKNSLHEHTCLRYVYMLFCRQLSLKIPCKNSLRMDKFTVYMYTITKQNPIKSTINKHSGGMKTCLHNAKAVNLPMNKCRK